MSGPPFVYFARRRKVERLVEAIGYLPELPTADEVANWTPGIWDNLVRYVNAMADEREGCTGRPSDETKRLVVLKLRRLESPAERLRAVERHTETVVEPMSRRWA